MRRAHAPEWMWACLAPKSVRAAECGRALAVARAHAVFCFRRVRAVCCGRTIPLLPTPGADRRATHLTAARSGWVSW